MTSHIQSQQSQQSEMPSLERFSPSKFLHESTFEQLQTKFSGNLDEDFRGDILMACALKGSGNVEEANNNNTVGMLNILIQNFLCNLGSQGERFSLHSCENLKECRTDGRWNNIEYDAFKLLLDACDGTEDVDKLVFLFSLLFTFGSAENKEKGIYWTRSFKFAMALIKRVVLLEGNMSSLQQNGFPTNYVR